MTFTFKLERLDGTPAELPSFKTTILVRQPGDRSLSGAGRCKSSASATAVSMSCRCWSSRTWPKERLAPSRGES
jgi:hypothetical protein